jgi:hypothetical protein
LANELGYPCNQGYHPIGRRNALRVGLLDFK